MFIKIFFIQKSKSSTHLDHEEGKQEEAIIDKITTISDSWGKKFIACNLSLRQFSWGEDSFPRGNYVGDQSSLYFPKFLTLEYA